MVGTESIRAWVQGLDGVEEHELHERPPWHNHQYDASVQSESSNDRQQAQQEAIHEESTDQPGSLLSLLGNESAHSHDFPAPESQIDQGARDCPPRQSPIFKVVTFIAFAVVFGITVWLFTRPAGRGLQDNGVDCGPRVTAGQSLSPPLPGCEPQPSSTTFTAIAGFYIIPPTTVADDRFRVKHGSLPFSTGESFIDKSSVMQETLVLSTAQKSALGMFAKKESSKSLMSEDGNEPYAAIRQEEAAFSRWGVEFLYRLHRRTASHTLQIKKKWCIDNTCSSHHQLKDMCNETGKEVGKKKNKDPFEKQECDWCWDEKIFPKRNITQQAKIEQHCEKVAKQSAIFLSAVCGFVFVLLLALATILTMRKFSDKKKMRASKQPQRVKENLMDPNNEPRDPIPIMPQASGPRGKSKSSNSERMGFGSLTGLGKRKNKDQNSESPRKSTRRSRLMSSGSQHIPLGAMSRKPFVAGQSESQAGQDAGLIPPPEEQ